MAQESTILSEDVSGFRAPLSTAEQGRNLFLVGFLVLFMELACIRWFAACVIFLQFFTNVMLLACFLGMSCGCLAARGRRDWLGYFPHLALGAVLAAIATLQLYKAWDAFAIDVGHQASPQEVFFGTEYHNPDVVRFVVPMDLFVAVFFVLVSLMFVGLGQVLGRAFDAYPNRVKGYTLNIGGSLAGITLFSLASFSQAPPFVWFLICCAGIAYLLHQAGSLTRGRIAALVLLLTTLAVHPLIKDYFGHHDRWSPYYAVDLDKARGSITVNTIGHQQMVPFETGGSSYSLVHLLQQHSGGAPFRDVLVIGAGSGNDLAHALRFGAAHVDAVEIDPVIQDIGIHNHPDHPYQDPRVINAWTTADIFSVRPIGITTSSSTPWSTPSFSTAATRIFASRATCSRRRHLPASNGCSNPAAFLSRITISVRGGLSRVSPRWLKKPSAVRRRSSACPIARSRMWPSPRGSR
jgi:hypothetical protein